MEKVLSSDMEQGVDLLCDDYVHITPGVIYSPVCVPGVGAGEECESQFVAGCSCENGSCTVDNSCQCVITYGKNYDENLKLVDEKWEGPVVECNVSCQCIRNGNCNNSVVRKGPFPYLEIFDSGDKGKAIRALVDIEPGTFLCEYAGEIIGREEAAKRIQSYQTQSMNYIFHLKEHLGNGTVIHTYVDPMYIGNIGRYMNHSCEPNCFVVPVRIDCPVPRLAIFASCNILSGEEVCFDYGSGVDFANDDVMRKKCLCGTKGCKQFMPYDKMSL